MPKANVAAADGANVSLKDRINLKIIDFTDNFSFSFQAAPLHKTLFEKVKRGEVDEVVRLVRESGIDLGQVMDEAKNFSQSLAFTACIVRDQELALKMMKVLVDLGVDPNKEDTLKQIPIFYAAREGNNNLISYLISLGS